MLNKVLLIICDGISDRPLKELNGKTPLEAAKTPNLDKLSELGISGLMHTIDVGIRPGSDVAHLSIFGYDPYQYYSGRGPFEAFGLGIDLKPGDIAFRGNFATVDETLTITDRRAGRIENTHSLVESLNRIHIEKVHFLVKEGTGHRAAVVLRGNGLSGKISDNDPHLIGLKAMDVYSLDNKPASKKTAKYINEFLKKAYEVLSKHPLNLERINKGFPPANYLLLRGAGEMPSLTPFSQKYGLKSACIAGAGLYKGIGKMLGMKVINIVEATGKPNTNIQAKIKAAISALKNYEFIFVHIKGADVLAEDGDFQGKKEFIEKIDKAMKPLINLDDVLVVITADHSTSSELKMHTSDPVPVLLSGWGVRVDDIAHFGERSAASGKLGFIKGAHLMKIILDLLGKAPLYGA